MSVVSSAKASDRLIPWYFVAFFVVLAVLDGVFVYLAVSTRTGVVTDKAYKHGIEYNQVIARAEAQEKLGWQGRLALLEDGKTLRFTLHDKAEKPLAGAKVTAHVVRPTQDGYDFTVSLVATTEAGTYQAGIAFPLKGIWDVRLTVHHQQRIYRQTTRITAR